MKILIFSPDFIEYTIELANSISEHENVILMLPKNRLKKSHYNRISKKVTVETYTLLRQRNPACIFMMKRIMEKINYHNPDVLHIQAHGYLWFFIIFPFLKKYPIVNTVHDPKPHLGEAGLRHKIIIRNGIKYSDYFIVHGNKLKKQMMDYYNIPKQRIANIPHGNLILYNKYSNKIINEEDKTIMFFGRLWKYKGLEYLIKAEPLITKEIPELKIILAFHGESFKHYEKFIKNRDRFEIHERYIPNEEISIFFQRASVVVLPYIEASQSGVVALSFAFGKPVVATNVGSIPEVVHNGKTGFIVRPKNEKALAHAIIKLLKDNKLRKEFGENAYKFATTELSWDRVAELTIKVYDKAINAKKISI